ncbi:MAG: hypothetical protein IPI69_13520 [Bacteroidales bacterium]|nr:hypothetical protein [Bacteroidales bacterium]
MDFKKRILSVFITVQLLIITSCYKQYYLEINGSKQTKVVEFSCGKIEIVAYCVSRSMFFIKHNYNLNKQSKFYRDSLTVEYAGEIIPYEIFGKDGKIDKSVIEINNGEDYEIQFAIKNPLVNDGDTITIKDLGYLYCDNQRVNIGTISLIVRL